ncbi:MAG TPA: hypothetical protein VLH79_01720 [Chthonomonadales bacterium]|nr:hypothetical protein [Chthonomonadales bacterium]
MAGRDRETLRSLASRWMELAADPVMQERKLLWTALKDLRPVRTMVLFETWTLEEYVRSDELVCEDPLLRGVEHNMRWTIRQAEEVGDDIVVEPVWRVGWDIRGVSYGVDIPARHAADGEGGSVGYRFDHPIRTPDDLDRLTARSWRVDRESTRLRVERLQEAFGDILPVRLHGTSSLHAGLTQDAFKLLGNDNLLTWVYDAPDSLRRVMTFLRDDRLAFFDWLEREELLGRNNHWTFVGSGSPGYTTAIPDDSAPGPVRLTDLWVWMESQETSGVSPGMFRDFFLPAIADVCARFGLVYYGCCEAVHDRWRHIADAIPHVRAVSVSPWCNMRAVASMLNGERVFSRKPAPSPISGASPDWDALRADLEATVAAASGCPLEIVFRDVYRIHGDRPRLRRWAELARERSA